MEQVHLSANKSSARSNACHAILPIFLLLLAGALTTFARGDDYGPNIFPAGSFEAVKATYVPWAGVDGSGNLHGIEGKQLSVDDAGHIGGNLFAPSMAVADMNGDGKPDLVMADSTGFFWYYPNSGTPQKPAFTQGEVIPIWLGEEPIGNDHEGVDDVVPRLQLVDIGGSKKYDVVAGTYTGKFFHIANLGSGLQPLFKPTLDRDQKLVNTHRRGLLWCNYLAPCLTTALGSGNALDLVMGEGTYSANSIYLLHNTGSNEAPTFDEDHLQKIIPGMGLEQLAPVVLDWNNDGKPDVLCGTRTGFLVLYLNNSTDPSNPTFEPGVHVKIGGVENLGGSVTVALADLTGNHLPNLLIGKNDGTISYAVNTGKLGAPQFNTPPTPLKGVLPPDYHYIAPTLWSKDGVWGAPDELIACVNAQNEPNFAPPEGSKTKYALKFSVWPVKNICFPERYYPPKEYWENEHIISCVQAFRLKLNKRYRLHFWVKADGNVDNLRFRFYPDPAYDAPFQPPQILRPVSGGSGWTEVSEEIRIDNDVDPAMTTWGYHLSFRFNGQTSFYLDDVEIQEEL